MWFPTPQDALLVHALLQQGFGTCGSVLVIIIQRTVHDLEHTTILCFFFISRALTSLNFSFKRPRLDKLELRDKTRKHSAVKITVPALLHC